MGLLFSKIFNRLFRQQNEYKMLILGLQNSGKTTLLYQLHLGKMIQTQPTIGSNVEEVQNKNVKFQVWDLGGQETLRSCWETFFSGANAIIFVIDSSEISNETEALNKSEFSKLLQNEDLKETVFLIMANKQDVKGCLTAAEISEKMGLSHIKSHQWHIQPCCAKSGENLAQGLEWITNKMLERKK